MSELIENLSLTSKALKVVVETTLSPALIKEMREMRAKLERAEIFINALHNDHTRDIFQDFCEQCYARLDDLKYCYICSFKYCPNCSPNNEIRACIECDYPTCSECLNQIETTIKKCDECDESDYLCDSCMNEHIADNH